MGIGISWYERNVMKAPKNTAQKCIFVQWIWTNLQFLEDLVAMEKFIFCAVGGLSEVLQSGINKNWVQNFSLFWRLGTKLITGYKNYFTLPLGFTRVLRTCCRVSWYSIPKIDKMIIAVPPNVIKSLKVLDFGSTMPVSSSTVFTALT